MPNKKQLIDLEDALRKMENAEHLMLEINGIKAVDIGAIRQFFGMLTPVDAVEVVHGRWLEKTDMVASYLAGCEEVFYECSVCNSPNEGEPPYCPNCGAKMEHQ